MNFNNILYIILLGSLFIWTSCGDDFLEIPPDDFITEEEFINTPGEAQAVLNSAYEAMSSGNFLGGQAWLLADLMADNVEGSLVTNGDWLAHYTRTTDIFLGTTRSLMSDGYKVAGRANFVIDKIDLVPDLSGDEKARMTAEAKFLRAIAHFEQVRLFAQPYGFTANNTHLGVPVHTSFTIEQVNRSTVAEVYTQVINDMKEAGDVLPNANGGYATSLAAKGYLAKVYFQMNDFPNAWELANEVIEMSGLELDTLGTRFSQAGSSETIFQLISTDLNQDNSGGGLRNNYWPNPGNNNIPNAYISNTMAAVGTSNPLDKRGELWYEQDEQGFICRKFVYDTEMQVPLVHLTELKLIRAESAGELGTNLQQAIDDLNDIKNRAGVLEIFDNTPANLIVEEARKERRLEMVLEGNRLHELKRQAVQDSPNLLIRGARWDCPGLVCQFPDNELKGNPDIEPNAEGGCN